MNKGISAKQVRRIVTVKSSDHVRINLDVGGDGPDLLLVHGTGTRRQLWLPIRQALETCFTVRAMDRRGYGESGDASVYTIEREQEDIARCIEACGPHPVDVVAHSYGALCALGAANMGARINRLILYEPPIPISTDVYFSGDLIPLMSKALDRGDSAEAVRLFLVGVLGLSHEIIVAMQRVAAWTEQLALVSLMFREIQEVDRFYFRPEHYATWTIPTLLLTGENSPPQYRATADALRACLPGSEIEILPGQRHAAISAAPALFAASTLRFLRPTRERIN